MSVDLSQCVGELAGARLGPCRACKDYTVLPAFGDGRCFGCTVDEIAEPAWAPEPQVLAREPEPDTTSDEIRSIFDEAQRVVPTIKILAGIVGRNGSGSIRRNGGWVSRSRRFSRWWLIETPRDLRLAGAAPNEAVATYYRGLRKAHQAVGLCGTCSAPAAPGEKLCKQHQQGLRARYFKWKLAGVCGSCGRARVPGRSACAKCLRTRKTVRKNLNKKRRAKGICIACPNQAPDGVCCKACADKRNERKRAKRSAARQKRRC